MARKYTRTRSGCSSKSACRSLVPAAVLGVDRDVVGALHEALEGLGVEVAGGHERAAGLLDLLVEHLACERLSARSRRCATRPAAARRGGGSTARAAACASRGRPSRRRSPCRTPGDRPSRRCPPRCQPSVADKNRTVTVLAHQSWFVDDLERFTTDWSFAVRPLSLALVGGRGRDRGRVAAGRGAAAAAGARVPRTRRAPGALDPAAAGGPPRRQPARAGRAERLPGPAPAPRRRPGGRRGGAARGLRRRLARHRHPHPAGGGRGDVPRAAGAGAGRARWRSWRRSTCWAWRSSSRCCRPARTAGARCPSTPSGCTPRCWRSRRAPASPSSCWRSARSSPTPRWPSALLERFPFLNVAELLGLNVPVDTFIAFAASVELLFGLLIVSRRRPAGRRDRRRHPVQRDPVLPGRRRADRPPPDLRDHARPAGLRLQRAAPPPSCRRCTTGPRSSSCAGQASTTSTYPKREVPASSVAERR